MPRYGYQTGPEYADLLRALDAQRRSHLKISEILGLLGVSRPTFFRWRRETPGLNPAGRNGRGHKLFLKSDLEAWLKRRSLIKRAPEEPSPAPSLPFD